MKADFTPIPASDIHSQIGKQIHLTTNKRAKLTLVKVDGETLFLRQPNGVTLVANICQALYIRRNEPLPIKLSRRAPREPQRT